MSYYVGTWTKQLSAAARKRAQAAITEIDPSAEIVLHNDPSNSIRMWVERPNDGTNNEYWRRERNERIRQIVNQELE